VLQGARFDQAHIDGADLHGNEHDTTTRWPDAYQPPPSITAPQEAIASMDLAQYLAWHARNAPRHAIDGQR
jgi:hypothetical protein